MSAEQQLLTQGNSFKIDNITFSHHMASVNGTQLHYVMGGKGDPVVLLHGWPQTWYEWRYVMPALAQNYTLIAPDLPGLGDSTKPPTGYDTKTVPRIIEETRRYTRDFDRLAETATTAQELYDKMLELYPNRVNPEWALWSSVRAVKP